MGKEKSGEWKTRERVVRGYRKGIQKERKINREVMGRRTGYCQNKGGGVGRALGRWEKKGDREGERRGSE